MVRTPTLTDCQTLARMLHPRIVGLDAAYGQVRPLWEARDLFGARRFAKDLQALKGRWGQAVRTAQKHRAGPFGKVSAEKPFERMVRAVRQGGMASTERAGDLTEMTRRLEGVHTALGASRASRTTAKGSGKSRIGYDVLQPFDSALAAGGSVRSVADCGAWLAQYGDSVAALVNLDPDTWRTYYEALVFKASPSAGDNAYADLNKIRDDWASVLVSLALKAGDPAYAKMSPSEFAQTIAMDSGNASNPAADEYDQLMGILAQAAAWKTQLKALIPESTFGKERAKGRSQRRAVAGRRSRMHGEFGDDPAVQGSVNVQAAPTVVTDAGAGGSAATPTVNATLQNAAAAAIAGSKAAVQGAAAILGAPILGPPSFTAPSAAPPGAAPPGAAPPKGDPYFVLKAGAAVLGVGAVGFGLWQVAGLVSDSRKGAR